ncbi:MAG TPA: methionine adenosyltransferase [Acidimicrobiales bacterium]|jgi:S-adenosylmethionine synthetase|nr:methionine adenosyltransferase [Acidimicrobiales bacterium]
MSRWTFTSESVTEGHPDKMADQISDSVLDAILADDPTARVACETLLTTGLVVVAGEITTTAYVEIPKLVREVVTDIGYTSSEMGFDGRTCGVTVSIGQQSPDIAQGVDTAMEVRAGTSGEDILNAQGAGDQGMMFGYACDETEDLMPMPIWLAHRLAQRLSQVRKAGVLPYLRPDGKTQVTFEYEDGRPVQLKTVLISTQHKPDIDLQTLLLPDLRDHVIAPLVPSQFAGDGYRILANPTGKFELGGPHADAGLTGRKIIVDTYGGAARHGGGAFSGKDPSKVDRSAAYAARWVAKHVVASGAANRCEIQVAYAIGVARPVSLLVETFGTEKVDPARILTAVDEVFDLRPAAIIRDLDLRRPIYRRTAAYGHFGRADKEFSWEQLSRLDAFKSAIGA